MPDTLAASAARGQETKRIKTAAINYAQRKLRVIGLHHVDDAGCTCRKITCTSPGKHNRFDLSYHGAREPYASPDVIEHWREPYNIGISLGDYLDTLGYYLYAFDVDEPDAVQRLRARGSVAKETVCSSTGRGLHVWVASRACVANFIPQRADTGAKLGEFRGEGQYVVVPPSGHVTGRTYAWISATRSPLMVGDPIDYVAGKLDEVGIKLSVRVARCMPTFVGGALPERPLPAWIETSLLLPMVTVRHILRGDYEGRAEVDRSGKLWWFAKEVIRAARWHNQSLSVEELAGIVKRADLACYRCYCARSDADRQYSAIAVKSLSEPE